MKNKEIAELFEKMGTLLEIKGEIVFKTRAYFKAAENINNLAEDIETVKNEKRLSDIPGIGKTLQEKIVEYLETGKLTAYEKLTKEIPESILDVINIPSVGPKKAKLFFDKLKIKDVPGLRKAAESKEILQLEGIKEKTVENILKGIKVVTEGQARMNLGTATRVAEELIAQLQKRPEVKSVSPAGSLRRGKETIRDIDILVDSTDAKVTMDFFCKLPQVKTVSAHGETKSSILTEKNVQVDLRILDHHCFGAGLLYFTGSKNFNVKLRQIAMKNDMKVSEYGIFSVKDNKEKFLAGKTEAECFKALGMPFIPPELREDIGEDLLFKKTGAVKIPKLIELGDIKGELHVHSTWSDGHNTIAEMADAAQKRGYQYLAISDHSPRLKVARGVSVEDLKKKKAEIEQLNKKMKNFRILFGTEVEIDSDGNLDYNDSVLSEFDIVVAAVHSGFEQDVKKLTQRIVKACQHKSVHIIAHPTGVHLGKRDPYALDLKEVCKAARDHNVFLEINAFPIRLDLNSKNAFYAKNQGVHFVINTDSHNVDHFNHLRYGISVARRAWLTKQEVLNSLPLKEMLQRIKK
ncbi:MAG: DNA polymerase/3'-5' exonuclease PolX [Candidatus Omnitrophica bacterium]|nr:DNA polymerase/3'-5' exonuclease PolX [Candidatus Omnitrophota bacterium]